MIDDYKKSVHKLTAWPSPRRMISREVQGPFMISGAERVGGQDFGFRLILKSINIPPDGSRECRELVSLKAVREKGGRYVYWRIHETCRKGSKYKQTITQQPFKNPPLKTFIQFTAYCNSSCIFNCIHRCRTSHFYLHITCKNKVTFRLN